MYVATWKDKQILASHEEWVLALTDDQQAMPDQLLSGVCLPLNSTQDDRDSAAAGKIAVFTTIWNNQQQDAQNA